MYNNAFKSIFSSGFTIIHKFSGIYYVMFYYYNPREEGRPSSLEILLYLLFKNNVWIKRFPDIVC